MAAFEPTLQNADAIGLEAYGDTLIAPTQTLRLPKGGRGLASSAAHSQEAVYWRTFPQRDIPTMARFVRRMVTSGKLDKHDLQREMAYPTLGLFRLSALAGEKIGAACRLKEILNTDAIIEKLDVTTAPVDVSVIASAGVRMGMFSPAAFMAQFNNSYAPEQQLPLWWLQQLRARYLEDALHDESDFQIDMEGFLMGDESEGDEAVAVMLSVWDPTAIAVTVPGDDTETAIVIRDALMAVLEAISSIAFGLSPSDCICMDTALLHDAEVVETLMEAHCFTAEELEELVGDIDEGAVEFDEILTLETFSSVRQWAEVMVQLSTPRHWLTTSALDAPPTMTMTVEERQKHMIEQCRDRVDMMRQQYGSALPAVCDACERAIDALATHSVVQVERHEMDGEMHDEGEPLTGFLKNVLNIVGGESSQAFNEIFERVMPGSLDAMLNSGMEYKEAFILSRSRPDSALALGNTMQSIRVALTALNAIKEATEREIPALLLAAPAR